MNNRSLSGRHIIVFAIIGVLILAYFIRLFDLQIVKGEEYSAQAEQRLIRAFPVRAPRGEIVDRYDNPFVENRMGYSVKFRKINIEAHQLDKMILEVSNLILEQDGELETEFPIYYDEVNEIWGYTYTQPETKKKDEEQEAYIEEYREDEDPEAAKLHKEEQEKKLQEWKEKNKLLDYEKPQDIFEYYRAKYSVSKEYSYQDALTIVSVRYDMEESGFNEKTPYVLAEDVDELVVQQLKEQAMNFDGVEVEMEPVRVYAEGNMASHILGRTGKIYAEEYEVLKEQGYGINDIIGKDGLEKVLEPYLKGQDGYRNDQTDENVKKVLKSREVVPGNFARLTLDLELQKAMEKSLEKNITEAVNRNGAGGAIAIIPSTGEVLAMASYPDYDPDRFDENYDKLVKAKSKPLFNRVLNGVYSPGSTFKPLTAIAGLETGVITPETFIEDKGRYTFFPSYQPTCLIYSSKGETHGYIDVSEAIGVSCNYFFYEVGRLVGIDKLNEYAKNFGLGEETGIELGESTGLVAGPAHRKELGQEWYPGDVIQAAIGQSDNLFTPAQLANYIATVLNKGRRYRLHLVNEIVDYDTGEVVHRKNPEVLSETSIADSTFAKVKDGMRQVVSTGTASAAFKDAEYQAAGKTGTAEVPDGADNVLFVGFAPYDSPEIVVAVVIEHGATSHYAAKVARDVFDAYMELKEKRLHPEEYKKNASEKEKISGKTDGKDEKPVVKPAIEKNSTIHGNSGYEEDGKPKGMELEAD